MHSHPILPIYLLSLLSLGTSTIVVGREFGSQEGELLSHIDAHEKLLSDVCPALSVRENDVDDLSNTAQARGRTSTALNEESRPNASAAVA